MSKYFSGQSQGSYLPPGFMQTATQPGQYYAAALASVGKSIGEGIRRRGEKKKDDAYFNFIEATGKIDDATKSVTDLVAQGKPLDTPESKAFGQKTAGDRNQALNEADYWDSVLKQKDDAQLLQLYVSDQNSNADPNLRTLFGEGEKKIQQAANAARSDLINSALDPTRLGEVQSQNRLMGMDGQFGETTPAPANIPQPPPAPPLDPNGLPPLPTMEEAAALNPELYPGFVASGSFNEGEMVNWTDSMSYEDQNKVMTAGLKKAKAWARGKAKDLRALAAQKENTLAAWEQGREIVTDDAGNMSLGDLIMVPGQVERKLTEAEKRDMAESKLSEMARSMGRERFKEARVQLDKIFPDKPDVEIVDKGGALLVLEDGAYKAMMAKPATKGNSMFEQLPEAVQKLVPGMQDDVRKDPTIKGYIGGYVALNKLRSAASLKTGAGDLALITSFMKALDPESVVRESEMAAAQGTAPAYKIFEQYFNTLTTGEKLTTEQRTQIVAAGEALVAQNKKDAQFVIDDFREVAVASGIPAETADKLILPRQPGSVEESSNSSGAADFIADLAAGTLNPTQPPAQ